MGFYICLNGELKGHQFDYLSLSLSTRLEPTLVPGRSSPKNSENVLGWVIECMSKEPLTLKPASTVEQAMQLMKEKDIHHIPLVQANRLVGMVSDRDISWLGRFDLEEKSYLKNYMSQLVLAVEEETPVEFVARVMVREKISALPVVNDERELTGIITHNDLLRFLF